MVITYRQILRAGIMSILLTASALSGARADAVTEWNEEVTRYTQDELKLVLEALKWCHGCEPCGIAEAIAVIEKALANVATNDTSK